MPFPKNGCGTHPIGLRKANAWGLYDMIGNVYEWVWDSGDDGPRSLIDPVGPKRRFKWITRGGSWGADVEDMRAANRAFSNSGNEKASHIGFRLVRTRPIE